MNPIKFTKGDKFHRLTYIKDAQSSVGNRIRRRVLCRCDCGKRHEVSDWKSGKLIEIVKNNGNLTYPFLDRFSLSYTPYGSYTDGTLVHNLDLIEEIPSTEDTSPEQLVFHAPSVEQNLASNDPKGEIGATKAPLGLIPTAALVPEAWALKQGADRYGLNNWRTTGVCASTYINAMLRHLTAWRDGEDNAEDSGVSHLGHIRANCAILLDAMACGTLVDDRSKTP